MRLTVPRKRWWLLAGAAVAVVALAAALTWPQSLESRAKRIRPRMTQAEVGRVLGRPPDWSGEMGPKPARSPGDEFWHPAMTEKPVRSQKWTTPATVVYVWYIDGAVESVDCVERDSGSLWDRIRARLPW
ncbi:MAG TPA: hypothetical protein VKE40_09005 [Gemmataceae bacterium]|nr:hypothetical protein [Gemmataceae bacterium]